MGLNLDATNGGGSLVVKGYWDRTRDEASHDPIPIPLGYRGHVNGVGLFFLLVTIYSFINRILRNYAIPGRVRTHDPCIRSPEAVGSLVLQHRSPDGLGSMPPNTLQVHTEYVFVKSVGLKVLWAESRVQGAGEYFPPLKTHGKIVEVEIGGVAIYRPFGKFRRANSFCHLYSAQCPGQQKRTSSPLPR
ncbi:uncharacterized protein TNCV_3347651 [Trichonephila clavipes]|nr:uncharacterized protein TNCV_3347651 [Trichonephila clavipes]